jgi:hypothetical protein
MSAGTAPSKQNFSDYIEQVMTQVRAKNPAGPVPPGSGYSESLRLVPRRPEYRDARILERVVDPGVLMFAFPGSMIEQIRSTADSASR